MLGGLAEGCHPLFSITPVRSTIREIYLIRTYAVEGLALILMPKLIPNE
jgi:hypothetical protein